MYIDAIVIVALIVFAFCWFRKINKIIYSTAAIDIFLRILNFVANNINAKGFKKLVNNIFPDSIVDLIEKYTSGLFCTILTWAYVVIMTLFLLYTIRGCVRKKV